MKAILSLFAFIFSISFTIFVLLPYDRCSRVERLTEPLGWMTSLSDAVVSPWVSARSRYRVSASWVRVRITASNYLRRQLFLGKDETPFQCPWDFVEVPEFEDTALGKESLERDLYEKEEESGGEPTKRCYFFFNCKVEDDGEAIKGEQPDFTGYNEERN